MQLGNCFQHIPSAGGLPEHLCGSRYTKPVIVEHVHISSEGVEQVLTAAALQAAVAGVDFRL